MKKTDVVCFLQGRSLSRERSSDQITFLIPSFTISDTRNWKLGDSYFIPGICSKPLRSVTQVFFSPTTYATKYVEQTTIFFKLQNLKMVMIKLILQLTHGQIFISVSCHVIEKKNIYDFSSSMVWLSECRASENGWVCRSTGISPDTQGFRMDSVILMWWPHPLDCSRCLTEIFHALFNWQCANVGSHIF